MTHSRNPLLIRFGKHLKTLRKEKKLSPKRLAILCGVEAEDIKEYEAGEVDVNFLLMIRLAKALEVELWLLMDYKD